MEFTIDLILRIHSNFSPLYMMVSTKMKELKTFLQDVVDKGFVQPNVTLGNISFIC